jgi:hypothetical protein
MTPRKFEDVEEHLSNVSVYELFVVMHRFWRTDILPIPIFYVISQNSRMTSWQFYFTTFEFSSIHLFLNIENIKWNLANACNKPLAYYYASDCVFV